MQFLISLLLTVALWGGVLFFWLRYQSTERKVWLIGIPVAIGLSIAINGKAFQAPPSTEPGLTCFHFRGNECF